MQSTYVHISHIHSLIHTYNKLSFKFSVSRSRGQFPSAPARATSSGSPRSSRSTSPFRMSFAARERTSLGRREPNVPARSREVTRKKRVKLRVIRTKKDAIRTKITQPHGFERVIVLCVLARLLGLEGQTADKHRLDQGWRRHQVLQLEVEDPLEALDRETPQLRYLPQ